MSNFFIFIESILFSVFKDLSFLNYPVHILEVFIVVFVSFFIGLITMSLYTYQKRENLVKEKIKIRKEFKIIKQRSLELKKSKDEVMENLRSIIKEKQELEKTVKKYKDEFDKIFSELNFEKLEKQNLTIENESYKKKDIESVKLKDEINNLKIVNSDFKNSNEKLGKEIADLIKENKKLKEKDEKLEREKEENIQKLKEEKEESLQKLKEEKKKFEEDKKKIVKTAKDKIQEEKEKLLESIGIVLESDKEDLKQLRGIGPYIEKKLNVLGIFAIRQIANFKKEDISRAESLIKYFPGRIKRDRWVEQAKEIQKKREKALESLKK